MRPLRLDSMSLSLFLSFFLSLRDANVRKGVCQQKKKNKRKKIAEC